MRLRDEPRLRHEEHFNPRTPCGVRQAIPRHGGACGIFQSTHPLRGATAACAFMASSASYFNPRTPCGVRPALATGPSIPTHFNPRTPCGVRLLVGVNVIDDRIISIHAPLAGCDYSSFFAISARMNFNPRTPCGVRHGARLGCLDRRYFNPRTPCGVRPFNGSAQEQAITFQSTHPLRGATYLLSSESAAASISIHAPLAGCD